MPKSQKSAFNDVAATEAALKRCADVIAEQLSAGRISADDLMNIIAKIEKEQSARRYRKLYRELPRLPKEELGQRLLAAAAGPHDIGTEQRQKNYLRKLAKAGADIETRDERGYTPLMAACETRNFSALFTLIDLGADVNANGYRGETPLTVSMRDDDSVVSGYLARKGADVNARDASGETALMISARKGHPYAVKYWLERGADARLQNRAGKTAYDLVAPDAFKYTDIREMIGADIARRNADAAEFREKLDENLTLKSPMKVKRLQLRKP